MKSFTYFFIVEDKVYRMVRNNTTPWYQSINDVHYKADTIILMTDTGRGKTIKDRKPVSKQKYYTKKEMVMLTLQAENV
jgi:hypothetical protein